MGGKFQMFIAQLCLYSFGSIHPYKKHWDSVRDVNTSYCGFKPERSVGYRQSRLAWLERIAAHTRREVREGAREYS